MIDISALNSRGKFLKGFHLIRYLQASIRFRLNKETNTVKSIIYGPVLGSIQDIQIFFASFHTGVLLFGFGSRAWSPGGGAAAGARAHWAARLRDSHQQFIMAQVFTATEALAAHRCRLAPRTAASGGPGCPAVSAAGAGTDTPSS